ncbi:hypothetical protein H1C71_002895, partial [Ictidomys tridecemlineatus]
HPGADRMHLRRKQFTSNALPQQTQFGVASFTFPRTLAPGCPPVADSSEFLNTPVCVVMTFAYCYCWGLASLTREAEGRPNLGVNSRCVKIRTCGQVADFISSSPSSPVSPSLEVLRGDFILPNSRRVLQSAGRKTKESEVGRTSGSAGPVPALSAGAGARVWSRAFDPSSHRSKFSARKFCSKLNAWTLNPEIPGGVLQDREEL